MSGDDGYDAVVQPERYAEHLQEKAEKVRSSLNQYVSHLSLEVYESPPVHYRLRCRFDVDVQNGNLTYVMWRYGPGPKRYLASFPVANERINDMMPRLLEQIEQRTSVSQDLVMVHFLSTLNTQDMVITLVYGAAAMPNGWENDAEALAKTLGLVGIVGKCRGEAQSNIHPRLWKRAMVVGRDYVEERFVLDNGQTTIYRQPEGRFSNPNGAVNIKVLDWLARLARGLVEKNGGKAGDLLEMYCGNGNHTCVLARHFSRVLAVELDQDLVAMARHNLEANGVKNATVLQVPSERFSQDILRTRCYANVDFRDYYLDTVLVDPPRGGLDNATLRLLRGFPDIIYVSCNPESLARNMERLGRTHEVMAFAVFDHFPYTPFIESVLHLRKMPKPMASGP